MEDFTDKQAPSGYFIKKSEDEVIYYNVRFDENTSFPRVFEASKTDENVHVQLQYCLNPVPLPNQAGM